MGTGIVIAVLVIMIIIALQSSMKHLKGEGGCCGGGSLEPKVKRQRLKNVVKRKRMVIAGMQCDNCRKRVENSLNSINLVSAKVDLKTGNAIIDLGREVKDDELRNVVEKAGYKVLSIADA